RTRGPAPRCPSGGRATAASSMARKILAPAASSPPHVEVFPDPGWDGFTLLRNGPAVHGTCVQLFDATGAHLTPGPCIYRLPDVTAGCWAGGGGCGSRRGPGAVGGCRMTVSITDHHQLPARLPHRRSPPPLLYLAPPLHPPSMAAPPFTREPTSE